MIFFSKYSFWKFSNIRMVFQTVNNYLCNFHNFCHNMFNCYTFFFSDLSVAPCIRRQHYRIIYLLRLIINCSVKIRVEEQVLFIDVDYILIFRPADIISIHVLSGRGLLKSHRHEEATAIIPRVPPCDKI